MTDTIIVVGASVAAAILALVLAAAGYVLGKILTGDF